MTACRCERCCPEDPAPTYTRSFLIECLARDVAALPSLEERRAWLGRWEHNHGPDVTRQLKEQMRALWDAFGGRRAD